MKCEIRRRTFGLFFPGFRRVLDKEKIVSSYNTLAHRILDYEWEKGAAAPTQKTYKIADDIIRSSLKRGKGTVSSSSLVETVKEVMRESGYRSKPDYLPNFLRLELERKAYSNYATASIIMALSVAEIMENPLEAVLVPWNVLLSYTDESGDKIFAEPISGRTFTQEQCMAAYKIQEHQHAYLHPLSEEGILALDDIHQSIHYFGNREYEFAEVMLNASLEKNPQQPEAIFLLALAYERQQKYDDARKNYQKATELNPNLAEAYHGLGFIYLIQGDPARALENFKKATELDPDFYHGHYHSIVANAELKNWDAAQHSLGKLKGMFNTFRTYTGRTGSAEFDRNEEEHINFLNNYVSSQGITCSSKALLMAPIHILHYEVQSKTCYSPFADLRTANLFPIVHNK